ncbi:protein C3orf33 homolog isoform X3 [Mus pahari]|uniref:protein C3orf33 homolog isoform X3 n=1 Tax=Mus pahari TaxID=10093 RepID=UPI0011149B9D|nr:protein C3orf33 homolog isoform X3 [Mus pahari]
MARPPGSLGSQAPDRDRGEANVVTRVSQWADNHLRLVQNISTGMAIAGIMLLIRSIRLTSKFTTSSDIPVEFIRKKVKLRGRLQRITECGLEIEHIPITLPFISSWKKEPRGVLLVKLAGVELTEGGKVWLQSELKPSQLLWFQLLGKEDSALFCYLLVNKVNTAPSASISCVLTRRSCKKITDSPLSWLASVIQGFTCLCLPAPGSEPKLPCLAVCMDAQYLHTPFYCCYRFVRDSISFFL